MRRVRKMLACLLVVVLVCTTGISTCAADQKSEAYTEYTVKRGDTLRKIAREQLGDVTRVSEIVELNSDSIKDPNKIRTGMVIKLPTSTALTGESSGKSTTKDATKDTSKSETKVTTPIGDVAGTKAQKVGDRVNGFQVKSITRFDLINADVIEYEHIKTGAIVMYLANDDTNRMFDIVFKTPALDDTGVPHVFEHSTLDGSAKYPSKTLWFNLSAQTYNTYMNAATYNFMTAFPVASLSEAQLLKYADLYTDAVFYPMIDMDRSIFEEECWRYSLASADADLEIAGTVYSEMRGAWSISRGARLNFLKTLYPGSKVGNDSGGDPDHIPEMTWQDVCDFHDTYYHPSNSLTLIYGKFEDFDAFLSLLDSYFKAYDKVDIVVNDPNYEPLMMNTVETMYYPLASGANTDRGAYTYYGFAVDAVDLEDINKLDFLTSLLADDSSLLGVAMNEQLPHASWSCYTDMSAPGCGVIFYAYGINEDEASTFRKIVDDSLAAIAREGFDRDQVDAYVASSKIDVMMTPESSTVAEDMLPNIAYYWAASGDEFGFMKYIDAIDDFERVALDGTLTSIITESLLDENTIRAQVTTVPAAGLKDEKDAAFAAKLAEIKASMDEQAIDELVKKTAAYGEPDTTDNSEYIKQLTAVEVSTLPEEIRIYDIDDTTDASGIRHVDVHADVDAIGQSTIMLDASGLTQSQIQYFKLFTELIGKFDTKQYTNAQLSSKITRYLYSPTFKVSLLDRENERGYDPYMRITFTSLNEDREAAYGLINEMLFNTDFSNLDTLKGRVQALATSLKNSLNSSSYNAQLYRAMSDESEMWQYFNSINYFDYYEFLCAVEKQLDEDPTVVINALNGIASKLKNSTGAIAGYVGNAQGIRENKALADAFLKKLGSKKITKQTYSFDQKMCDEAIITDAAVQYNMIFLGKSKLGHEDDIAALNVIAGIVNDEYLIPLLRDQYGAYGVIHGFGRDQGVYIISYRDPNVAETFQVYSQLPELVKSLTSLTQEEIDGYILSTYAGAAMSAGELTGGYSALINHLSGIDQSRALDDLRSLKSVNAETIAKLIEVYEKLWNEGVISTSGSASAINKNAGLYERICNPFGAMDLSQVELKDVPKTAAFYDAVRYVYENGYMKAEKDDTFGVNSPATLGEFANCEYMFLGGSNDPETAIAYLAQYMLVPAGKTTDTLTREELVGYFADFCEALGAEYPESLMKDYPLTGLKNPKDTATRADLACIALALFE